jgi:hypothetical protein
MNTSARALLVAIALGVPLVAAADGKPKDQPVKPSSFAPHPGGSHVYGAPLGPPVVGPTASRPTVSDYNKLRARVAKRDKAPARGGDKSRKSAARLQKRSLRNS